jgi:hypothetical protein
VSLYIFFFLKSKGNKSETDGILNEISVFLNERFNERSDKELADFCNFFSLIHTSGTKGLIFDVHLIILADKIPEI